MDSIEDRVSERERRDVKHGIAQEHHMHVAGPAKHAKGVLARLVQGAEIGAAALHHVAGLPE